MTVDEKLASLAEAMAMLEQAVRELPGEKSVAIYEGLSQARNLIWQVKIDGYRSSAR